MADIFVLCVVDGESLVNMYEEAKGQQDEKGNWVPVNRKYLTHSELHPHARMITRQQNVLDHQASDDLTIKAEVDDMIQWRAISITDDRVYKVWIDGFQGLDHLSPVVHHKSLDYWEAQAAEEGDDRYWVDFVVKKPTEPGMRDEDAPRYFFHWDPGISVR